MWLEKRLALIRRSHAVVVVAGPETGVNRLISALAADGCLAWLVLEEDDENDAIAQGIKLSDALKLALGSRLFPRAIPYQSAVAILERYRGSLGPLTIAVSGVRFGMDLAVLLMAMSGQGCRVVLSEDRLAEADLARLRAAGQAELLVLDEADLRLTEVEARATAKDDWPQGELRRHLEEVDYAYEPYLTWLSKSIGTTIESQAAGNGNRAAAKPPSEDPELLLDEL